MSTYKSRNEIFSKGVKKFKLESMDLVHFIEQMRDLEIMKHLLLTPYQRKLMRYDKLYLIDHERSNDSATEDLIFKKYGLC
jgi:hypothetical protein